MSKRKPKIKPVLVKFDEEMLSRLDAWCREQNAIPSRAEVIRAAVGRWLVDFEPKEKRA